MTEAKLAVNFFVALFALIDPIGNVPLFAAATLARPPRAGGWWPSISACSSPPS